MTKLWHGPMQSKSPIAEELEEELMDLGAQRAAARRERQEADDCADEAVAEAAAAAALGAISRGAAPSGTYALFLSTCFL